MDSISTKDVMEKTHQLPISVMIKERRLRWLGHAARVRTIIWSSSFFLLRGYPDMCNLWHLDALCYEGCEVHGSANGLPQPRMELAERSHEQTYLGEVHNTTYIELKKGCATAIQVLVL